MINKIRIKKLYRGVSEKELITYKNTIPVGKRFTTNFFTARKFGKKVIQVNLSKTGFNQDTKQNPNFKILTIGERYYFNKKPIKRFTIKNNI